MRPVGFPEFENSLTKTGDSGRMTGHSEVARSGVPWPYNGLTMLLACRCPTPDHKNGLLDYRQLMRDMKTLGRYMGSIFAEGHLR